MKYLNILGGGVTESFECFIVVRIDGGETGQLPMEECWSEKDILAAMFLPCFFREQVRLVLVAFDELRFQINCVVVGFETNIPRSTADYILRVARRKGRVGQIDPS